MELLRIMLEFIAVMLAIDFVSGLVHWAEDTFGTESTPIIGGWIVAPNEIHHQQPTAFTHKNWWQSSWDLLLASTAILLICWWLGFFNWQLWLFCILGANANQLHKYAHLPAQSVPRVVRVLQYINLLQSARHHAAHHRGAKNQAYCVITPYLNPLLDKLRFWRALERITVPLFGAPRREDLSHLAPRAAGKKLP